MCISCVCDAPQRDLTVYVNKQGLVADLLQEAAKELQVKAHTGNLCVHTYVHTYIAQFTYEEELVCCVASHSSRCVFTVDVIEAQ